MKRTFTILLIVGWYASCLAQETNLSVKSKIDRVTVFLAGAQVTRVANVSVKPGVTLLSFSGIAPGIQEQSIQVEGPPTVKILSVSFKVNYLEELKVPEKIAALEDERRRLWASLVQEKSVEEVYREEEAILKTNKSIGGTEKGVPVDELKIAMDYFRQRLMDIKQQMLLADRNIKKYNESISKLDAQLKELSTQTAKPTGEIVVKISTKTSASAPITIKYLVQEARWFPSYDIRVKDIQSPISITYKANVSQQSGEDWENVSLTISSGNPSQGGARPIVKPWILGFNNVVATRNTSTIQTVQDEKTFGVSNSMVRGRIIDENGEGLPGVNVLIKGSTAGTVTDAVGNYSIPLTADAQTLVFSFIGYVSQEVDIDKRGEINARMSPDVTQLTEVVTVGYGYSSGETSDGALFTPRVKRTIVSTPVIRQTDVEYTLDELFSVMSDGEMRTTDMVEYELDALYEYYCVPKLDADAFLMAKVLNWDEHNFLEGAANLFFEGKYIGKSVLDTRATSDTLSLSLGRDGNVVVKREKIKDYTSRHVVGSNQKSTVGYEISIRNKKAQALTIVVEDQVPIANDKDISVDKVEDSDGEFDSDTGLLKWKKEINPGKTEVIALKYSVKFPKNSRMILE